MEEKKKGALYALILLALVIAVLLSFLWIIKLENRIVNLENALNTQHRQLMNQVESIYRNVDQMLQEEASLLSGVQVHYGSLDPEHHTVDVTVELVPKLISGETQVKLSINGRSTTLTRKDNTFTGSIAVDLFNQNEQMLMTIESETGTQTQYLSQFSVEYLWLNMIPSLYYCDIFGTGHLEEGKYSFNGSIDFSTSTPQETMEAEFVKFELVTFRNGEEISREQITEKVLGDQEYPYTGSYHSEYTMQCDAKEGDTIEIYAEATDSVGYLHRVLAHYWKQGYGALEAMDTSEYIYDPEGVQVVP